MPGTTVLQRAALLLVTAGVLLDAGTPARAEVPLRWDNTGHVVVPAIVNGTAPVDFLFDTGADDTHVFAWLSSKLELPTGGSGEISGATGSASAWKSRVDSLAVDGHVLANFAAVTLPDRPDAPHLGGIVGADLMQGTLTVLDFGCGTAALLPRGAPQEVLGSQPHLIKAGAIKGGRQLTLPVQVNAATGLALLDSGARGTLINHEFARVAGLHPDSGAFRDGEPARGATRTGVATRVGLIGTVRFAGITRTGVNARIVDLPFLKDSGLTGRPVMVLGLDLMRGTRISVDYAARRFWVAASSCPAAAAPPLAPPH